MAAIRTADAAIFIVDLHCPLATGAFIYHTIPYFALIS